jgi:hypothetical protein
LIIPTINPIASTPRTPAQARAYLKKGPRQKTATNQKARGQAKIHYGRKTFQKPNGNITITTLTVQRKNATSKPADPIFLFANERATDQGRQADYMASAMDQIPITLNGNRFHYSTIMLALEQHARESYSHAIDTMANHDTGAADAAAIGFMDS